jgi:hypothetical protein
MNPAARVAYEGRGEPGLADRLDHLGRQEEASGGGGIVCENGGAMTTRRVLLAALILLTARSTGLLAATAPLDVTYYYLPG